MNDLVITEREVDGLIVVEVVLNIIVTEVVKEEDK